MTCTLLSFSSPKNLEKRRRRQVEYRLLQFAVHLEYRVQELSQKLRQSQSQRALGQWSSPAKRAITEVFRVSLLPDWQLFLFSAARI